MRSLKLLLCFALLANLFSSCSSDIYIEDYVSPPSITLNQLLSSHELWYVDLNETIGYGETPWMHMAFTLSFRNGVLYANNNLVGLGSQGNGFGIATGNYDAYDMILDVYHVIDGYSTFDVYQIDYNTIELYNPYTDTSYFLEGYQRSEFDYDYVFYDNIHYFLQEYEAWEKTYTSQVGNINEFDNENYLQFLPTNNDSMFRSSQDFNVIDHNDIYWDYTGDYFVNNVPNEFYLKNLTLDYDFFGNEQFELSVINDARIQLYHLSSGTYYEFTGRGYIEILRQADDSLKNGKDKPKMRKQKTVKKDNPRVNERS